MDKLIRKKFIASCKKGMEEVGDFHLFLQKSRYIWPGELVYVLSSLISNGFAFVVFSPNEKYNSAALEVGWSHECVFSDLMQRPSIVDNYCEMRKTSVKGTVRVGKMAGRDSFIFVKQGEEGVVASEMISLLIEYGIP